MADYSPPERHQEVTAKGGPGAARREKRAAKAAKPGQFIVLCPIGMDFPAEATEAEKLYYPNEEQWEQSTLFRMREKLTP